MKREKGEPAKLSLYEAWKLAYGSLPKRRKRWEVVPYTPMRFTSDGKTMMDPELDLMEFGDDLVYMRDRTKDQADTIRTHHTRYNKLLDQYWDQNAELVALKQDMDVMKEKAVNDTATIKCLKNSIAIHKRWELSTEKQIEDMKLEFIECKKNKRTPTEMQHAELQRLKKVHDASRAPVTDEEKQEVLKAVEAADAIQRHSKNWRQQASLVTCVEPRVIS